MKNLTWQNPEQLFVAQELINKVKSKCCGIKVDKEGKKNLHGYINDRSDRIRTRTLTYIVDRNNGFAPNCNPSQYDYRDNEEVVFDIFETINPKTNLPFGFAVNIRPACEE